MIRILLLIVALGSGGAAGWLALNAQNAPTPMPTPAVAAAPRVVERPTVDILVAAADIAPGQAVSEANLQWAPWPENAIGSKFILRSARPEAVTELAGQLARREILAQEPVAAEKLMIGGANALAAGKRAAAVRITAETTAGGFILPNDRVDVLHTTVANGQDGHRRATTMTILHDVPVLAIDQTFQSDGGSAKAKGAAIGRTATLELTPEQSERLVAAESSGTVSLVLRPVNDRAVPAPRPEPAAAPQPAPRAPETIRITRGMQVQVVRRPGMPDEPIAVAQP